MRTYFYSGIITAGIGIEYRISGVVSGETPEKAWENLEKRVEATYKAPTHIYMYKFECI